MSAPTPEQQAAHRAAQPDLMTFLAARTSDVMASAPTNALEAAEAALAHAQRYGLPAWPVDRPTVESALMEMAKGVAECRRLDREASK